MLIALCKIISLLAIATFVGVIFIHISSYMAPAKHKKEYE